MSEHVVILLSALAGTLTTALLILQLYGILAVKMDEHLQRLNYYCKEKIRPNQKEVGYNLYKIYTVSCVWRYNRTEINTFLDFDRYPVLQIPQSFGKLKMITPSSSISRAF